VTNAEQVLDYGRRGWRLLYYKTGTKGPAGVEGEGWTDRTDMPEDYTDDKNVGTFTGHEIEDGRYLHDLDFDLEATEERRELLRRLMPEHTASSFAFGRPSKPVSHILVLMSRRCTSKEYIHPTRTVTYIDEKGNERVKAETIVELRGGTKDGGVGHQTMLPPSKHPSGERLAVRNNAETNLADDTPQVALTIAVGIVLLDHLPAIGHDCRNALIGFLLKAGLPAEDVRKIVSALVALRSDNQGDLEQCFRSTVAHFNAGSWKQISGKTKLLEYLSGDGKKVIECIERWIRPEQTQIMTAVEPVLTFADSITPTSTMWLWDGRIPVGQIAILAGREGIGKSTLAYELVSAISRGRLEGEFNGTPRVCLVSATEDSRDSVIVPRLMAAGADLSKIAFIQLRSTRERDLLFEIDLPENVDVLYPLLREHQPALLLLDPLMSRISGKLDTHKDSEVRRALEPLSALADAMGTAVLGIMHLNKSNARDPLNALMGSRAFSAVSRSVLVVVPDPDDESGESRLVLNPKNNNEREALAPRFQIVEQGTGALDHHGREIVKGRVEWTGHTDKAWREIIDALNAVQKGSGDEPEWKKATEWLRDLLEEQECPTEASAVSRAAQAAGFGEKALRRAAKELDVIKESRSVKVDGKSLPRYFWVGAGQVWGPLDWQRAIEAAAEQALIEGEQEVRLAGRG
jgi:hypothetical protein